MMVQSLGYTTNSCAGAFGSCFQEVALLVCDSIAAVSCIALAILTAICSCCHSNGRIKARRALPTDHYYPRSHGTTSRPQANYSQFVAYGEELESRSRAGGSLHADNYETDVRTRMQQNALKGKQELPYYR